jgi:hypothetical protein
VNSVNQMVVDLTMFFREEKVRGKRALDRVCKEA